MYSQVLRNFQRILVLQTSRSTHITNNTFHCVCRKFVVYPANHLSLSSVRRLHDNWESSVENNKNADSSFTPDPSQLDSPRGNERDYIVEYCLEHEKPRRYILVEALRTRYRLTDNDVERIMKDEVVKKTFHKRSLVRALELLCLEGVTKESFLSYPWILTIDKVRLQDKLTIIRTLPVRDINHFVPFLRLTLPRLRKLVSIMNSESKVIPQGNRVYYISELLNTDPKLVTKYLSKRLFILEMPFEMLEQNLKHMINYNVSPINILKDLWAFRYTPKSVELRLERAKRAKKDKIMPWMVRCPEPILQRSFKLTLDELAVLGDKKNVVEYVAERLEFDVETMKCIMERHPAVMRVRVTKIKEVLDYLLNEAGFTRHEIANVPRILCHGLDTTKQRIEELKSYGCRPTSLVIVCRSKREYEKFVKSWLEMDLKMHKYKEKSQTNEEQT
ncbi:transcription termination factor, mitochondrial [Bactrocera neohumeralis]|uniref:transcription termination factor, mitochondrial n=1 Tax=Bactrocera neohumeralis TaxID=98809 RepID=UPI0021660BDA|nr:transcription termination factor, mitochondrial [Bactrocera neohumeralis]